MAKKKKIKIPQAWTREQKDAEDRKIFKAGGSSIADVDENGNVIMDNVIPVRGRTAQKRLKKSRRPKVKPANE